MVGTHDHPIYDEHFVQCLPSVKAWGSPLVASIARGETAPYQKTKALIAEYYCSLPESCSKMDVYQRLRSCNDRVLIPQLYEVLVWDFCRKFGKVNLHPILPDGGTPDMIWIIDGNEVLLDVVTVFGDKGDQRETDAVNKLLRYLGEQVEHHFNVFLEYEEIDESALKPSVLREKLVEFLDTLDPDMTSEAEVEVSLPGFKGRYIAGPRKDPYERRPLAFGVMERVRWVEPARSVRGRIREKIRKYGDAGRALLVAVCPKPGSYGTDWDDVASVLYGPIQYVIDTSTHTCLPTLESGGLVIPHGRAKPQNTSLTGVLHCKLSRDEEKFGLNAVYLVNPFAFHQLDLPLPTYPVLEEGKAHFRWSSAPEVDLGLH